MTVESPNDASPALPPTREEVSVDGPATLEQVPAGAVAWEQMDSDEQHAKETAPPAASKNIPEAERVKVYVRSGGRCALCNEYVLEDDLTLLPVNLGELAHNVGRKQSAGSPRGLNSLPVDLRNEADNLLLLCRKHHKVIDAQIASGEFTVDQLREIKAEHEDRIKYVTGLGKDAETVVVRLVGDVRGVAPEVSRETVRGAVTSHARRYPRFELSYGGGDIEIDLRNLPAEGSPEYATRARDQIKHVLDHQLATGIREGAVRHLSIFALARIPLLVLFGYELDDKVPTDIYQKRRSGKEGWEWDPEAEPVAFEHELVHTGSDPGRVTLVVSVSGSVDVGRLPDELAETTVYRIRPTEATPNPDILRAEASLGHFASCYRSFLSLVEQEHPKTEVIAVVPAAPVSAAVAIGRGVMRDAHPTLHIYDRTNDHYEFALEIN
jgi:hypothetical protein